MAKTKSREPLVRLRPSMSGLRTQGERMVTGFRRDVGRLAARSRKDILKEVRELERRLVKRLHAATEDEVARLERRVAKLERGLADLQKRTAEDQAA